MIPVTGGLTQWINWDREAFPYLAAVTWDQGTPPVMLVQNREQTKEVLSAIDPATGATQQLFSETDDAWLNLDAGMPEWLPSGEQFLWSTERAGGWQLELHGRDGARERLLTSLDLNYRRVCGQDEGTGSVLIVAGPDPTESHIYRVPLAKDAPPERLTKTAGVHSAVVAAESGAYVLTTQTLTSDPQFTIHARDGKELGTLKSVAETTPLPPRVELTTVGEAPAWRAAIVRPADFQTGRKYPVIVSVYGGPHSQMVLASRGKYLLDQWLAEQGFVVVSIDGRGTPARGRTWERAIHGNLIDVPLADQVAGLRALGAKYAEFDLERVGIYGWSFGGYFSAMAVLREPDFFRAGIAGAPVTDWLDYDTHYTERYLGLPSANEAGYTASSVLNYAKDLRRPLLVIHGTADDNVTSCTASAWPMPCFASGVSSIFSRSQA